ncbi:MAG: hypothetical protein HY776_06915 [Actinobacteria bacterium]|nr:hypothetical protein [Actinomycetota bacterium]
MGKSAPKLSMKSSKTEMMEAYSELLAKFDTAPVDKQSEIKKAEEKVVVEKASTYTVESIIKGLAELNVGVGKSFGDLAEKLVNESNKLTELQKAIEVKSGMLKEIHEIDVAANSLTALLEAQSERKAAFEREMTDKQQFFETEMARRQVEWKKEQAEHEFLVKERDATLKKQREREQEEYEYALALSRKKDNDAYTEQKMAHEKEMAERSAAIAVHETEFAELKKKVECLPQELAEAVKKAEAVVKAEVKQQTDTEAKLREKEVEGDKRVAALKIASLEEAVAKQATQIESLTKQLTTADAQVQNIAVKAIEGASGLKALAAVNEIALEQAKTVNPKNKT